MNIFNFGVMFKRLSFLVLLISSFASIHAQKQLSVDFRYKHGFLVAHRPIMSHLPKEHTNAIEISINWQADGSKTWHQRLKNPITGFSFLGTSTGNKAILGNHFGAYGFMMYPFLNQERFKIYGRAGAGLGFANKVFDQESNPKNNAISSRVNALINFALMVRYSSGSHLFTFGLDMTHFSNGSSRLPNLGLNLPYAMLGYGYQLPQTVSTRITNENKSSDLRKWRYHLMLIGSVKDTYPTGHKRTGVLALNFAAQRIFTVGKGFESGFDLIYKPAINTYKPVIDKSAESLIQTGAYLAYLLSLGKMQIVVGMGAYLRDEYVADDAFYHRMGFRYNLNQKLRLNLTLKSHWAKADYVEYGVAYRF